MKPDLPKVRDADFFNAFRRGHPPEYPGIRVAEAAAPGLSAQLSVETRRLAPTGRAGAALAGNTAGYACIVMRPDDAAGFTTVEGKINHPGAAPPHAGRTTQARDAEVTARGKCIAVFRRAQRVLYPRPRDGG